MLPDLESLADDTPLFCTRTYYTALRKRGHGEYVRGGEGWRAHEADALMPVRPGN